MFTNRVLRLSLPIVAVIGLFTSGSAPAIDLYNNLNQAYNQSTSINNSYSTGVSFKTTAAETTVTSLSAYLQANTPATGNLLFSIYDATGSGGAPGTKITDAGTLAASTVTNAFQTYTISSLNIALSATTNYWLVVSNSTADFVMFGAANTTTGTPGSVGIATKTGPAAWSLLGGNYRLMGSITAISSVPEPTTWALAAIASGVLAWTARRRKV